MRLDPPGNITDWVGLGRWLNNLYLSIRGILGTPARFLAGLTVASGNVGIGTTTPTKTLDVSVNGSTDVMRLANIAGSSKTYLALLTYNGDYVSSRIGAVDMGACNNSIVFEVANNGAVGTITTEVMRLTNAGKMGIGTNSPTSVLQVVGIPVHANNAAAVAAGLTAGAFYRTGADPDPVCVVH